VSGSFANLSRCTNDRRTVEVADQQLQESARIVEEKTLEVDRDKEIHKQINIYASRPRRVPSAPSLYPGWGNREKAHPTVLITYLH
jgi:hypothetical protein